MTKHLKVNKYNKASFEHDMDCHSITDSAAAVYTAEQKCSKYISFPARLSPTLIARKQFENRAQSYILQCSAKSRKYLSRKQCSVEKRVRVKNP